MQMSSDTRLALLEEAHKRHEQWGEGIERAVQEIGRSIAIIAETSRQTEMRHADHQKTVDRVFERFDKVDARMDIQDKRLQKMEVDMPGLREMRGWIVGAILAIVVAAGTLGWTAITSAPIHIAPTKS